MHVICSPTLEWGSAILEALDSELSGCGQLRELRLTSSGDQGWRDMLANNTTVISERCRSRNICYSEIVMLELDFFVANEEGKYRYYTKAFSKPFRYPPRWEILNR